MKQIDDNYVYNGVEYKRYYLIPDTPESSSVVIKDESVAYPTMVQIDKKEGTE